MTIFRDDTWGLFSLSLLCFALPLLLSVSGCTNQGPERYRKRAEQGNAEAQYRLGMSYYSVAAFEEDTEAKAEAETEAVKWFLKAAEQGHAEAQAGLAICYCHGQGVPKNEAEGEKWFQKAKEQGLFEKSSSSRSSYRPYRFYRPFR